MNGDVKGEAEKMGIWSILEFEGLGLGLKLLRVRRANLDLVLTSRGKLEIGRLMINPSTSYGGY